jgi:hypothetical protein
LEIPNDLAGGEVRCGSCLEVFVAPGPAGRDVPPPLPTDDPPRRKKRKGYDVPRDKPVPASRPDDGYGEVEFDPDRKRKQGVGPALFILFAIFAVLGCSCCGVFGWFVFQAMDPEYKEFKPADGRFVADFPAEVKEKTRETGRRGGETATAFEADRRMVRENYFIYYVDLKPNEKKDAATVVDQLCDGLKATTKGTEVSRTKRAHQGFDAADIVLRQPGKRYTQARVVVGDDRGYVVGVTVSGDPQGMIWLEHFFESFEIVVPEKKDEKKDDGKKGERKKADEKKAVEKKDED